MLARAAYSSSLRGTQAESSSTTASLLDAQQQLQAAVRQHESVLVRQETDQQSREAAALHEHSLEVAKLREQFDRCCMTEQFASYLAAAGALLFCIACWGAAPLHMTAMMGWSPRASVCSLIGLASATVGLPMRAVAAAREQGSDSVWMMPPRLRPAGWQTWSPGTGSWLMPRPSWRQRPAS